MNRYYVYDLLKFKVVAYTVAYIAYVVACVVAYVAYDKGFLWLYLGILKNQSQRSTTMFTILRNFKDQSKRFMTIFGNFKNQSQCFTIFGIMYQYKKLKCSRSAFSALKKSKTCMYYNG